MRFTQIIGATAVALVASFASANAQQGVQVGVLNCEGGQNVSFVLGSDTTLNCVFQSQGRRADRYTARIKRFGLDLGFTQQTRVSWAAFGPRSSVRPGDLAGQYDGVGANASFGVGFGGNFLLGRSGYALQPIALQGQTGLNVAAGIASVELVPVAPERRKRNRRN
jgi:hypothetical protein